MIGVFPDPYPGEIFYSVCARLCERAGYSKHRIAMQDIFGSETVIASVTLPSHLDDLVGRLPSGNAYTSDYLITEHTLLPLYSPFLPPERLNRLRQDISGRNGPSLHMRSGIMASRVPLPEWLRFCPQCVIEDKKQWGECYWHRVHQASGVEICPLHKMYLCDSNVRARNNKTRHEFVSAERAVQVTEQPRPSSQSPYYQNLLHIARDVYWLLCQHNLSQDLTLLHHRYRKLLSEIDLATYRGRVDISMFLQKFRNYYPSQLLQLLHCELEEHIQESWLLRLVRAPHGGAQHPLYHLLFMHFLGQTAESFFGSLVEDRPFGVGPWPCLNPVCNHYYLPFIAECRVVHSPHVHGKPIGTFECACSFVYSRTGPDVKREDQFKRSKIKSFGSLWEMRLQTLWQDETASLRAMARQLGVDPLTVKHQALRIGLPFPRPFNICSRPKIRQKISPPSHQRSERDSLEEYRTTWLATMQTNPGEGIRILRSKAPRVYTWLYRHDKAWLKAHAPSSKKSKLQADRVDWEKRDFQLAEEVKVAAHFLKNLPERPILVTISAIGREIGQLALLQQHLDKLPRVAKALEEHVESRETFAVRRIQWTLMDCSLNNIYLERWQLIRKAGVARLAEQPQVKDAIDEAWQALQPGMEIYHDSTFTC
jgi:Tn7-like transposition protein D/TniQ protein